MNFSGLIGEERPMDEMATRIAIEMEKNSTSWVLSTAAALYWRVKGQASEAVQCLRHSLYYAPREMKDIPLVSLANILHRAGNRNSVKTHKFMNLCDFTEFFFLTRKFCYVITCTMFIHYVMYVVLSVFQEETINLTLDVVIFFLLLF